MTHEGDQQTPSDAIVPFLGDAVDIIPFEPQDPQAQLVAFSQPGSITVHQRHQLEAIAGNHEALEKYLEGARNMWPIMSERRNAPNHTHTETLQQMKEHYPGIMDIQDDKIDEVLANHPQIAYRVSALRNALATEFGEEIFEETGLTQSALTLQVLGEIAAHPEDHLTAPQPEDFEDGSVAEPIPTVVAAHLFSVDLAQYWIPDDYNERPVATLSEKEEITYRDNVQGPIRTVSKVLGVEAFARENYASEVARLTGLQTQINTLTELDPTSTDVQRLTAELNSGLDRLLSECPTQFPEIVNKFGHLLGESRIRDFQFRGEIAGIRALQALYHHVGTTKDNTSARRQKLTDLVERLHLLFPDRGGEIRQILGDTEVPSIHDESWVTGGPNDPSIVMTRAEMIGFLNNE